MVLKRSRWLFAFACVSCLLAWPVINAQDPQTAGAPAAEPCAVNAERLDTAVALLDRVDRLVTGARRELDSDDVEPVGTSGRAGSSGTVKVEAADLDEMHAEIEQIKLLLKKK